MEINKIKNKLIYFAARGEADPVKRNKNFKHSFLKKRLEFYFPKLKLSLLK